MRVNSVQNNIHFGTLQIRHHGYLNYNACDISRCKEKLANTRLVDVIIDSQGLAIKEKKTDILQRIQSFSLFPLEKRVAINMIGENVPKYKFDYNSLEEARAEWDNLRNSTNNCNFLDLYSKVALWLEETLSKVFN